MIVEETRNDHGNKLQYMKHHVTLRINHLIIIAMFSVLLGEGISTVIFSRTGVSPLAKDEAKEILIKQASYSKVAGIPSSTDLYQVVQTNKKQNGTAANKNMSMSDMLPRIVWLMSFPNSGTSFTGQVIRQTTRRDTASNYGSGNYDKNTGNSIPVHEGGEATGPFWTDPGRLLKDYSVPEEYVLTKTHCGGRCEQCGPERYIENVYSFRTQCLSGTRTYVDGQTGKKVVESTIYPPERVHKAVHLIRDPYDNIVSRFHLEVHEFKKVNKSDPPSMKQTREGFRLFCDEMNQRYSTQEKDSRMWQRFIPNALKSIPCHADFFRWVQWHNLASAVTQDLQIPTYTLNYENYAIRFNETLDELLEFLGQTRNGRPTEFVKGKAYKEYFDANERLQIKEAIQELSTSHTWKNIKHYFEE